MPVRVLLATIAGLFLLHSVALTGMPAPLPTETPKVLRLNDSAAFRFQAISFFLLVFLLSALLVKVLWNSLRKDFPSLPRVSFLRALTAVFLWGLLFVIVLTMISGARELMTPGSWKKQGFTYKVVPDPEPIAQEDSEVLRRRHMEKLRTALWQFAATHGGRFPAAEELTVISQELWEIPDTGGLRYFYVAGRSASHLPELLVYEPELDPNARMVLDTTGDIKLLRSSDLRSLAPGGRQP